MIKISTLRQLSFLLLAGVMLSGCQSTYYKAMEQVGFHKRDIMVDRIEDTQKSQEEAQEQFQSALDQFRSVVAFDGGDLEFIYNRLNDEYESSYSAAEKVRERINGVRDVSDALFDEWEDELSLYSSSSLRAESSRKLKDTRRRYDQMMASMVKAEKRMQPVLDALHDQVLYLKHNLNARAITALKGEFSSIKSDIDKLLQEMQTSIRESQAFINTLKKQ
ncbi:MAG: DNA repair protein [Oceanospirillales bacterium LUC14_002_19_P2]|nr:MAG: DNA repair protein [Oceanospirillales bacterium LUC14_002_19_P2]